MGKENDQRQQRLDGAPVDDGTTDEGEPDLDDFGDERPYWQTRGGYRRDLVNSLLQKAVRRSDVEIAQWAAWEMVRSGFGSNAWNRLALYLVEDIAAGETVILHVPTLERTARAAGADSRVSQIAAIKAATLCAEAWSSREAVHYDDYLRHVAELRVDHPEQGYDFPVAPRDCADRRDPSPAADGQMTFVDDGELEPDVPTNDYGETLREGETLGGYHHEHLLTVLDEAIAGEDIEEAGFVSWELARTGFQEEYWQRLAELAVEHAACESLVTPLIEQYENLATERWTPDDWEGRLCAIHAAITVIRADQSSGSVDQCDEYHDLAAQRADGDAEFPVEPEQIDIGQKYDVAADKHTRPGGWAGRDWKHFWLRASRCGPRGEPEHSRRWHRERLQMERAFYREKFTHVTDEAIERALTPVSADDRWEPDRIARNEDLDEYE